jgi:release factor glutamine methyltransferase
MTVGQFLNSARSALAADSTSPGLDAQVLLAHVLGKPRAWLLAHTDEFLSLDETQQLEAGLAALASGIPLPYIIGSWEFYGLRFRLTPDVLIPRPETELLVDTARRWLERQAERKLVMDMGTGSGCIAVSLAAYFADILVTAVDISPEAIEVARSNAAAHAVSDRIQFVQSDLFTNVAGSFDLICANPPYIPSATLRNLEVYGREPVLALDGGADGLDLIRAIIKEAKERLRSGGLLLVEIESRQGQAVRKLARQALPQADIRVLSDLAGQDRCLRIELSV